MAPVPFENYQKFVLAVIGVAYLNMAIMVYLVPYTFTTGYHYPHEMLPHSVRVGLWVCSGALALWSIKSGMTAVGFFGAMLMPTLRTMSYLTAGIKYYSPWLPNGQSTDMGWFIWWICLDVFLFVTGSWQFIQYKWQERRTGRESS